MHSKLEDTGRGSATLTLDHYLEVQARKAGTFTPAHEAFWVAARKASEEKGGGSLTEKDGVKSEFLKPTDYSPLK